MSVEKIKSDLYINNKGAAKNEVLNLIPSQLLFFFLFLEFSDNEIRWSIRRKAGLSKFTPL